MKNKSKHPILKKVYWLVLFALVFSGFAQMPIFKRYYIADIPGMAWTADFFATLNIHYISAMILLALVAYGIIDWFLYTRKKMELSSTAWFRIIVIAGLIGSGIFMVLQNLPDVSFSPGFAQMTILIHLGLTMLFLFSALVFLILRKGWVVNR